MDYFALLQNQAASNNLNYFNKDKKKKNICIKELGFKFMRNTVAQNSILLIFSILNEIWSIIPKADLLKKSQTQSNDA